MKKIASVKTAVKEDKVLGVFTLEGQEKPIFLTDKQVFSATGLRNNFSILRGSSLEVTYYAIGDKLANGSECTKADTIVKEYAFELAEKTGNIAAAAAFGASMF